jgi:hypothetical protein
MKRTGVLVKVELVIVGSRDRKLVGSVRGRIERSPECRREILEGCRAEAKTYAARMAATERSR